MDQPSTELVTIHTAPLTSLLPLEAALRAEGFHPFIADQNIKTIDPFITGGFIFDSRLQVPNFEAEEAVKWLEEVWGDPGDGVDAPFDEGDEDGPGDGEEP